MNLATVFLLQASILPAERSDFALYVSKSVPQRLNRLRKNAGPGRKDVPVRQAQGRLSGAKARRFLIIYGPTKVGP